MRNTELKTRRTHTSPSKRDKSSFRDSQLKSSGIIEKDQRSVVYIDSNTTKEINRYTSGTFNERHELVDGDDTVMHYLGLDRKPKEVLGNRGKRSNLVRVRYQNPELHLNREGNPTKYQSPYGSSSAIWIPELILSYYEKGTVIPTLFITEGERKADRACIAELPSVGVMGIHNIAGRNKPMPHEFEQIIKRCKVKNVVFILDADYDDLGQSKKAPIDNRPKTFLRAVANFRQYFYAFHHNDIPLNIYFGFINPNSEKGIDDFLQSKNCPSDKAFVSDVKNALSKGQSEFVSIFDITNQTEYHLKEFWHLQSPQEFAMHHKDSLIERPLFLIGNTKWKFNEGKTDIELAQPLLPHEIWWNEKPTKFGMDYEFNNIRCHRFLFNRGFGLLGRPNNDYIFIRDEDGVITEVNAKVMRDYCMNFLKENELKNEQLLNKMLKGAKMYFGQDSLSDINYMYPQFHKNDRGIQHFYFKDSFWRITSNKITQLPFSSVEGRVWNNQVVNFNATLFDNPLVTIQEITKEFANSQTDEATRLVYQKNIGRFIPKLPEGDLKKYEFLDFLWNTSNFSWREKEPTAEQIFDTQQNFLAKMTAVGHLLHGFRDEHNEYAIVAMEGNFIEGGRSDGGTGKSLLAKGIEKIVPVEFINGKKENLLGDQFLFGNVDESTSVVLIDDVRKEFDMEELFPHISGKFSIRPLGKQGYTLDVADAPKLYITTNFAPKENGRSYTRRRKLIAFSDFFNDDNEPVDYYGKLFFADWNQEQWNIFHNIMANCLQVYFQAETVIQPDLARINKRMLLQDIGQTFIDWADGYFLRPKKGTTGLNYNEQITKEDAYRSGTGAFLKVFPNQQRFVSVSKFKEKLWKYCLLRDLIINPKKPYSGKRIPEFKGLPYGGDLKVNGLEFIFICDENDDSGIQVPPEIDF